MSDEQIEKIFLPFERVSSTARHIEGTGLGLAIAQQIAKMMGSEIQVKSMPDRGSCFWLSVTFPLATDAEIATVSRGKGKIIGYRGKRYNILIVDDIAVNRYIIVSVLTALNFNCFEAENGREGWEKVLQIRPDLMITDLLMPVLDGWEMTQKIRQVPALKDTIIIASSASAGSSDRAESLAAGCNDFIAKPVNLENLLALLQKYLKLEWIYERSESIVEPQNNLQKAIEVFPPAAKIKLLLAAAKIGDIEEIENRSRELKTLDSQYGEFCDRLLSLAEEFDEQGILRLLEEAGKSENLATH